MSAPMVRALLAGIKTQTRRIVKPQPPHDCGMLECGPYHPTVTRRGEDELGPETFGAYTVGGEWSQGCPYGRPSDRLWVRETWNKFDGWADVFYAADDHSFGIGEDDNPDHIEPQNIKWRPSIHMPRWASRITLEVTDVRVERLQEIGEDGAIAEGSPYKSQIEALEWYIELWESINGDGSWDQNPLVWVIEFKRIEAGGR